jgi:hypothetical protein
MKTDKRINRLESKFKSPAGTIISRVLHPDMGIEWSLMLGQMQGSRKFEFRGDTIEECISKAEKVLTSTRK